MPSNWETNLQEQRRRMDAITPPSEQVAKLKALIRLNQIKAQAEAYGASMRGARPEMGVSDILKHYADMDVPMRSTTVAMPGLKQAGITEYMTRPFIHAIKLRAANLAHAADESMLEPPTDDPESLKWFQPARMMTAGQGVVSGWSSADEAAAKSKRDEMDRKVQGAKKMFEDALKMEYQTRNKAASAPELIDQMADTHVKKGFLDMDSLLQMYATGGTLLGAGARQAAKDYVQDVDPREMKLKAIKELLHQRIRRQPPVVRVEIPGESSQDKADAATASAI